MEEIQEQLLRYPGNRLIKLESLTPCVTGRDRAEGPGPAIMRVPSTSPNRLSLGLNFDTQYYFAVSAESKSNNANTERNALVVKVNSLH